MLNFSFILRNLNWDAVLKSIFSFHVDEKILSGLTVFFIGCFSFMHEWTNIILLWKKKKEGKPSLRVFKGRNPCFVEFSDFVSASHGPSTQETQDRNATVPSHLRPTG